MKLNITFFLYYLYLCMPVPVNGMEFSGLELIPNDKKERYESVPTETSKAFSSSFALSYELLPPINTAFKPDIQRYVINYPKRFTDPFLRTFCDSIKRRSSFTLQSIALKIDFNTLETESIFMQLLQNLKDLRDIKLEIRRRDKGFSNKLKQISPIGYLLPLLTENTFIQTIGFYNTYIITKHDLDLLKFLGQVYKSYNKKLTLECEYTTLTSAQNHQIQSCGIIVKVCGNSSLSPQG